MNRVPITQAGYDRLTEELNRLKKELPEVTEAIGVAREHGDISENAEYHAAKEAQATLQARLRDLEDKIARAAVVDESQIDASKAYLGATVRVLNKKTKREMTYTLVSAPEADVSSGKISMRSPVAQALAGKEVGDSVVANVPAGKLELEILEISR